jgi:hypothetical protein
MKKIENPANKEIPADFLPRWLNEALGGYYLVGIYTARFEEVGWQ